MKLAITGAGGLLGSALADAAAAAGHAVVALDRHAVDLADPAKTAALLGDADCLIHAAANTNVEQCEREPDACYRDNTLLTDALARAAARRGLRMAYISSTGVYGDGQDTPWHEYDRCAPTTHHHRSKLLGEEAVLRHVPAGLVVRTGWLFGGRPENPKNFVVRRLEEARAAGTAPIRSNRQQRGNPTCVRDVAARILALLAMDQAGVFNCVGNGSATRYDYVSAIVALAGLATPVEPADAAAFGRVARVPDNESAANWRAAALGLPPMPDWRDSLRRYLHEELRWNATIS